MKRRWSRMLVPFAAGVLLCSTPAFAQFSKGWKFLESVRDKEGEAVTEALSDPASNVVNTRDSSSGQTALHIVTERRDLTWMDFLIAKGADVNARDNHGVSPLVVASNLGFTEGVELLVRHGARVDEPSQTGETPLIAAVHRRDLGMMRILLAGGANPDRADNTGRTARDYAGQAGHNSPMLALIEELAQPHAQSSGGYGPSL